MADAEIAGWVWAMFGVGIGAFVAVMALTIHAAWTLRSRSTSLVKSRLYVSWSVGVVGFAVLLYTVEYALVFVLHTSLMVIPLVCCVVQSYWYGRK